MSLFLHMVGVEVYLALTPAESERLQVVSYEKQLEAGFENPGNAGLTAERWGDATGPRRGQWRLAVSCSDL